MIHDATYLCEASMIIFLAFLSFYCKFFEQKPCLFIYLCRTIMLETLLLFVTWFKERGWQGSRWLRNRCPVFVFFPKHTSSNTRYWKTRRESLCSCSGHTNCMLAKKRLLEPMMKAKGSCWIFAKVHTADNVDPREMPEVWRMAVESLIQGRTWSLSVVCLQVCDMPFLTSTWEGKWRTQEKKEGKKKEKRGKELNPE